MKTDEQQRLDEIAGECANIVATKCDTRPEKKHAILIACLKALAPVVKERDELKKSERRLKVLRELMGYVQAGEGETVHLFQDDVPTYTYHITVGKTSYWGNSFNEVIDKADEALNPTPTKETTK